MPSASSPDIPADDTFATGEMQLVSRDVAFKGNYHTRFVLPKPPLQKQCRDIHCRNQQKHVRLNTGGLKVARAGEIEQLKRMAIYRPAKWYCPLVAPPNA